MHITDLLLKYRKPFFAPEGEGGSGGAADAGAAAGAAPTPAAASTPAVAFAASRASSAKSVLQRGHVWAVSPHKSTHVA